MKSYEIDDKWNKMLTDYAACRISSKTFYQYLDKFPEVYLSSTKKINAAEKLRSKVVKERNLEVVYITGSSGSGKTTLAKYLAEKQHYDYFVSGSGEDMLDGYDKEECIILDDFRGGSMRFSELLKFIDNNTNSSVRSRYYNKDVSNCKLIIITSIKEPDELFTFMKDDEIEKEPIEQFYRRLKHHYFKIGDSAPHYIREYNLKLDNQAPTGKSLGAMADVFKALGINPEKVDDTSILDKMLVDATDTPF